MFTYDLTNPDPQVQTLSSIRLLLGDTTENEGPMPDGKNLSDEELNFFYTTEDNNAGRAVAAAYETLAAAWGKRAATTKMGPTYESSQQATIFTRLAREQRARYPSATTAAGGFAVNVKR